MHVSIGFQGADSERSEHVASCFLHGVRRIHGQAACLVFYSSRNQPGHYLRVIWPIRSLFVAGKMGLTWFRWPPLRSSIIWAMNSQFRLARITSRFADADTPRINRSATAAIAHADSKARRRRLSLRQRNPRYLIVSTLPATDGGNLGVNGPKAFG